MIWRIKNVKIEGYGSDVCRRFGWIVEDSCPPGHWSVQVWFWHWTLEVWRAYD